MNGTLPPRVTFKPYKSRKYAHFDDPLSGDDLARFYMPPEEVARHSFFPLVGYNKTERRMSFDDTGPVPALLEIKTREIRYAAHLDSAIYSQYAREIGAKYEAVLSRVGLSNEVLAYRGGMGSNIQFAGDLITEIKERGHCIVLCLDISGFFDNISHEILRSKLKSVLEVTKFPPDIAVIFRRLTQYEYVSQEELKHKIGRVGRRRLCQIGTFRRAVRPIIKKNEKGRGIPQGTPLSGLFANIAMLDFDVRLRALLSTMGGSYRRYSDDIAIVLPSSSVESEVITFVTNCLEGLGLHLKVSKTCRTEFLVEAGRLRYIDD